MSSSSLCITNIRVRSLPSIRNGNPLTSKESIGLLATDHFALSIFSLSLVATMFLVLSFYTELIAFEKGKTEDGWTAGSTMFGVHVCSKAKPPEEESSIVMCKGQMPLVPEVNMKLLQVQFIEVYNNTTVLAQQMRASGTFRPIL